MISGGFQGLVFSHLPDYSKLPPTLLCIWPTSDFLLPWVSDIILLSSFTSHLYAFPVPQTNHSLNQAHHFTHKQFYFPSQNGIVLLLVTKEWLKVIFNSFPLPHPPQCLWNLTYICSQVLFIGNTLSYPLYLTHSFNVSLNSSWSLKSYMKVTPSSFGFLYHFILMPLKPFNHILSYTKVICTLSYLLLDWAFDGKACSFFNYYYS